MNTTHSNCNHDNLMVSGGVVRCSDCLTWQPNHKDSDPKRGLVSRNQSR